MAMEEIQCILCNKDDSALFLEDEGYKAVRCRRCGLIYVNPRPGYSTLKEKYNNGSLIQEDEQIASAGEKILKARLDLVLIRRFKRGGRLLEIGCGEGSFLSEANRSGYDVYGIEINKRFVEYARNEFHLSNVFRCDISESSFKERYFDIIYMRNVLSHLHDPIKELDKINRFLKPDGIFICITGNLGDLSVERIKRYSDFNPPHLAQHLFHYSEANLHSLFKKAGFYTEKIYRFSAYLDECNGLLFRIINYILSKELSIKVLVFIRVLLGRLCFKKGRLLSLEIFASKRR
jgi:SAM-dependent methyltransferase